MATFTIAPVCFSSVHESIDQSYRGRTNDDNDTADFNDVQGYGGDIATRINEKSEYSLSRFGNAGEKPNPQAR